MLWGLGWVGRIGDEAQKNGLEKQKLLLGGR